MDNTDKSSSDKKMQLSKKEIIEFFDIGIKGIPILIGMLLLGSIFFNFFYFYRFNIQFMSLLSLSDYYEGSAIYIFVILAINFTIFYNFFITSQKSLLRSLSEYLDILKKLISLLYILSKQCISYSFLTLSMEKNKVQYNEKIQKSEYFKQEFKDLSLEIDCEKTKIYSDLKKSIKLFFSSLYATICFILIIFVSFIPLAFLLLFLSGCSRYVFIEIFIFYFFLYIIVKLRNIFYVFFTFLFMYFGFMGFSGYTVANFVENNMNTIVYTNDNNNYNLIRIISKGVIVLKDDKYIFIKWDDIKTINKLKN